MWILMFGRRGAGNDVVEFKYYATADAARARFSAFVDKHFQWVHDKWIDVGRGPFVEFSIDYDAMVCRDSDYEARMVEFFLGEK